MKVAVLAESSADEAAIKILIAAILERETEEISLEPIRTRGWSGVLRLLPIAIPRLYYHTDADGLVVVVDSDETPLHVSSHEILGGANPECRLCQLRNIFRKELLNLNLIPNRPILKSAIGLAVPAIEAWYRCGIDPHVNENTWGRKLQGEPLPYDRKSLKKSVYGTDRLSNVIRIQHAEDAARRLVLNVELLKHLFPNGFGSFVNDLQGW